MGNLILESKNLCKNFGNHPAVNNVSLQIERNSVYGLLGSNGAGKSTLLKIISGITHKSSGEIYFDGHEWSREDLGNIGSLIEIPALYENLSAWENLKVRTLLLNLPDARIEEVLDLVGLENTGEKKSRDFSLGMKQRLGIAIALLNRPKLLILDEPTNGLDPLGIQELRKMVRSFPDQGISVILSSHILSEIQQMADHVGIIDKGKLKYQGRIEEGRDLEKLFMSIIEKSEGANI